MFLSAFAENPDREGGAECEKGILRSLFTAIARAAEDGKVDLLRGGSAEDIKMPRGAAWGASLAGLKRWFGFWKKYAESGALSWFAFHAHFSTMGFADSLDQAQPKAKAFL
jgi:hypothetical protein